MGGRAADGRWNAAAPCGEDVRFGKIRMDSETILTVENLGVTLDHAQILHDVSFTLRQGEALAVLGPNGAGKTVLFQALRGLMPCTGTVRWQPGVEIGYVPQRFSIDPSAPITAMEFFLLQSPNFWRPSAKFIGHLDHELNLMGLDRGVLRKSSSELSGGETQRLLMAWAMLRHPGVLLLDEPTAAVDAGFEENVYAVLQQERGTAAADLKRTLNKTVVYQPRKSETRRYGYGGLMLRSSTATDLFDDRGAGDQAGGDAADGCADDHSRFHREKCLAQHAALRDFVRDTGRGDLGGGSVDR